MSNVGSKTDKILLAYFILTTVILIIFIILLLSLTYQVSRIATDLDTYMNELENSIERLENTTNETLKTMERINKELLEDERFKENMGTN